jgi:hypothetical protein
MAYRLQKVISTTLEVQTELSAQMQKMYVLERA